MARRLAAAGILAFIALLAAPRAAEAQVLNLTVNGSSIAFPDANPDLQPTIASVPATVRVTIRVLGNAGRSWQLTIAATDHLRAGASVINVGNISWTSSRANQGWLAGGTLAVAAPQTMAAGTGNTINSRSNIGFLLQNLWTYDPGSYTTSATLTLSAP